MLLALRRELDAGGTRCLDHGSLLPQNEPKAKCRHTTTLKDQEAMARMSAIISSMGPIHLK